MIKKLLALLMALTFILCAVSCATDPNAPDGMKSATVKGEPFTLYVPESWTVNTASGISGAYYASQKNLSVAARYHTPEDAAMTLEKYMELCAEANAAEFASSNYEAIESEDKDTLTLGGAPALKNTYKIDYDGVRLLCFQITTKHKGDFISLYGYCPVDKYEARKEDFDLIRENLKLGEKSKIEYAEVVDKSTPEGMKLASNKGIEYKFYVPKTWITDPEDDLTYAYYPESERSNVTVTSFVPEQSMSVNEYFKKCELEYKEFFKDSYALLSGPEQREVS